MRQLFKQITPFLFTLLLITTHSTSQANNHSDMYLNCKSTCLETYTEGLRDDFQQTVQRSANGAGVQHIFYSKEVLEQLGVDQKKMAEEINYITDIISSHFKSIPQYRGQLAIRFVYIAKNWGMLVYPEYEGQTYNHSTEHQHLNKYAICDAKNRCYSFIIDKSYYIDENPRAKHEINTLVEFYSSDIDYNGRSGIKLFPPHKEKYPMFTVQVIMGVNGHVVSKSDAQRLIRLNN